jgi:uncharacterized protein (DUF2235 family)
MSKNIVLCCDGTANEFAKDRTNVIKLYSALVHGTDAQVACYHPGIGTMEPFGALSPVTRAFTRVLGMAFGYGLEKDIRDLYVFLMQTHQPGDSVYLFGFSRGAFTVRAVASLIRMYGVISKGNEPLVPYAIRMMTGIQRAGEKKAAKDAYFSLANEFKRTMSCAQPRIRFVGVWDTVSSVGWMENPLHPRPTIPISKSAATPCRSTSGGRSSVRISGRCPRIPPGTTVHAIFSKCGFRESTAMSAAAIRRRPVGYPSTLSNG